MNFKPWRRYGVRIPRRFEPSATEEDILNCFRLILGRAPEEREWAGHLFRIGQDLESVVRTYLNSVEFSDRGLISPDLGDIELKELENFSIYASRQDSDIGARILERGTHDPHVAGVLSDHLSAGMRFVDIGANIGFFSLMAAALVGDSGQVFAVEPNPNNVRLLCASRQKNGFDHMTIVQAAAGEELGLLVMHAGQSNGIVTPLSDDVEHLLSESTVPNLKLDDVIPTDRQIHAIKIDAEGAEYSALSGFARRIERDHPFIVSEFSPLLLQTISRVAPEAYLKFLTDRDYQLSVIGSDAGLIHCGTDRERVMEEFENCGSDHIDLLAA